MSYFGLTVHSRILKLPIQFCWFFLGLLIILLGAFSVCDLKKPPSLAGAAFPFLQNDFPTILLHSSEGLICFMLGLYGDMIEKGFSRLAPPCWGSAAQGRPPLLVFSLRRLVSFLTVPSSVRLKPLKGGGRVLFAPFFLPSVILFYLLSACYVSQLYMLSRY